MQKVICSICIKEPALFLDNNYKEHTIAMCKKCHNYIYLKNITKKEARLLQGTDPSPSWIRYRIGGVELVRRINKLKDNVMFFPL